VPNKFTADIKEMVIGALNDAGGRAYLAKRAEDCPTAFLALVGRILPMQVTGANGSAIAVDFRWADGDADVDANSGNERISAAQHASTHALTIDGERATDEVPEA
jgi:hypothetical protein